MTTTPRTTGASCAAPVDADTIPRTYEAVLFAARPLPAGEREHLVGLLHGHIQLLVPELTVIVPRMRDEQRRTAAHVLARTRHMLQAGLGTSARDVFDLATQCRALFILHQHPGPLLVPVPPPRGGHDRPDRRAPSREGVPRLPADRRPRPRDS
ncbi:DUF6415 family natural product biosynthesis protein [Streptomyces sp. NPDC051738]